MSEKLVLKSDASPSYFNKDTLIGLLIGGPVGLVIGAFVGHSRLEDEKENGKIVTDSPSFWNKDTLLGGLLGDLAGGIAASLAFFAATGFSIMEVATAGSAGLGIGTAALATGVMVAAPLVVAGIALGAYLGGKSGQARQLGEFEEAKKQHIVEHLTRTVSPEVGKAVEYSMEHNKEWGKQVSEDRLLAQAQHHAI